MKKIFIFLFAVVLSTGVFAYSYPPTLRELFNQFCAEKQKVELITNRPYAPYNTDFIKTGYIVGVADDYILFKDGSVTIIAIANIVEVYTVEQ